MFSMLFFKLVTGPYPASHYSMMVKHPTTQWWQRYQLPGAERYYLFSIHVKLVPLWCHWCEFLPMHIATTYIIMSKKTKQWLPSVVKSIYGLSSGSPLFLRAAVHPSEHRWQIKLRFKILLLMHLSQPWLFFKYLLKLVYQAVESGQY